MEIPVSPRCGGRGPKNYSSWLSEPSKVLTNNYKTTQPRRPRTPINLLQNATPFCPSRLPFRGLGLNIQYSRGVRVEWSYTVPKKKRKKRKKKTTRGSQCSNATTEVFEGCRATIRTIRHSSIIQFLLCYKLMARSPRGKGGTV